MHTIGEELLLRSILAIDKQRLMRRDIESTAQILKHRRFGRLKVLGEEGRTRIPIGAIAAGQYIERAFCMDSVDAVELGDCYVGDKHAPPCQNVEQHWCKRRTGLNGLPASHAAAEANNDDVWATVRGGSLRRSAQI